MKISSRLALTSTLAAAGCGLLLVGGAGTAEAALSNLGDS